MVWNSGVITKVDWLSLLKATRLSESDVTISGVAN